jgi:hypothetical protein
MSGIGQTPKAIRRTVFQHITASRTSILQDAFLVRREELGPGRAKRRHMHERRIMPNTPYVPLSSIERPRCGRCFTRMTLARLAPLSDGSEQRTFECPKCNAIETRTVADPLKSEIVMRLTTNVRPPV